MTQHKYEKHAKYEKPAKFGEDVKYEKHLKYRKHVKRGKPGNVVRDVLALLAVGILLSACGREKEDGSVSLLDSLAEPIVFAGEEDGKTAGDGETADFVSEVSGSGVSVGTEGEHGSAPAPGDGSGANAAGGPIAAMTVPVIHDEGETLEERIRVPYGYERVEAEEGSLAEFLRSYPMKSAGAKVHLYDGTEKGNQRAHVAVFDLPIENYDLQQCADSVMRVYAEYFWSTGQHDRIQFHFTNGFLAEYAKWRDGSRITVNGNNVSWIKSKSKDDSYDCFVRYLRTIFCYAGTLSMEKESQPTTLFQLKVGDVFLYGGSPGHVVMVADVCENEQGKKAFLLAQGYMPAQEFHLLKNELHEEDPWYYEEEVTYPFSTPEYTFQEGSLRSLDY